MFTESSKLFLNKWENLNDLEIGQFLGVFSEKFLHNHPNWFAGYAPGDPSTNNALESTNNVIKAEGTLRERLPINQFLAWMDAQMIKWSTERNSENLNHKTFSDVPTKSLAVWTAAYQWSKQQYTVLKSSEGAVDSYFFSAQGKDPITEYDEMIFTESFQSNRWLEFDSMAEMRLSIWKVSVESNDWESATCTCPVFLKEYICKHSVGLPVRLKLLTVPDTAKTIPIGQKRKRGRPKKSTSALLR